ncbi:hypothetical protein PanWU01x14_217730, partial [Parasponia andersonii]
AEKRSSMSTNAPILARADSHLPDIAASSTTTRHRAAQPRRGAREHVRFVANL